MSASTLEAKLRELHDSICPDADCRTDDPVYMPTCDDMRALRTAALLGKIDGMLEADLIVRLERVDNHTGLPSDLRYALSQSIRTRADQLDATPEKR